ncbi:outer membrane lipoprotein chaperone LolA [Inmirania thermothiophila]|uniref:Outer-membrane lipoprotein carrier protein n=1 Tax=Inmirania thermothiophila TaxID=1750597 RepID=A0A3N1Y000_9GAMM|nr:outer membrane lipoprotein chaperone LolA [Inmirania thermothiophila]ROR32149.1 outer membrane lipoprotein carrier protein [Inmirania thermothiophila]
MGWFGTVLMLALAVLPAAAQEGDAVARLAAWLEGTRTLEGRFEQVLLDERGREVQRSAGTVAILRPGRFRWDYVEPARQLIVADGERLWFYDAALEQVTVRPLDEALGSAPSRLLSGAATLADGFRAEAAGRREGLAWVRLEPRDGSDDFARLEVGLGAEGIEVMVLVDGFGQRTRFRFSQVQRNRGLDPGLFRFEPPPGVDVVGAEAQ